MINLMINGSLSKVIRTGPCLLSLKLRNYFVSLFDLPCYLILIVYFLLNKVDYARPVYPK